MRYKVAKKTWPQRAPALLRRDPVQIPDSDPAEFVVPYDLVAPGLYPDETVFELDTGEQVAMSVSSARLPTGGGMVFTGWARVIEEDGSTMRDAAGEEMELEFRHVVTAPAFDLLDEPGAPAEAKISKEMMLLMLGEGPTMRPVHVDPDVPPVDVAIDDADWRRSVDGSGRRIKAPPGTVLTPDAAEAPIVDVANEVRMNASIRHALKMFARSQPEGDVAALLANA